MSNSEKLVGASVLGTDADVSVGLSIVLPAKNESQAIGAVVSGLRVAFPDADIIVVDDGSTDGTGAVARSRTRASACET